jgi:hypothetical protein
VPSDRSVPHRQAAVASPGAHAPGARAALLDRARRLLRAGTLTLMVCAGVVCAFYFWTAYTSPPADGYYALLADAFEHGDADLPVAPAPELLALDDPYDPAQNAPYRLHDASLFEGRYYLYFGPTPALLVHLPLRVVGVRATDALATALLCSVGFLFALALARFLMARYRPEASFGTRLAAVLVLGLANVAPFLLRRPAVYETAIAGGYACLMAGLYLTLTGALRPSPSLARLAGGSLALGLAVGARPHLGLAIPLWLWAWHTAWRRHHPGRRSTLTLVSAAGLPLVVCLVLLGAYNLVRFDSPFEFGSAYQLAGVNAQLLDRLSLDRLVPGAFLYLLAPPVVDIVFPFAHLDASFPGTLPAGYVLEPVAGALATAPVLALALAAPVLVLRRRRPRGEAGILAALLLLAALLVLLAPILTFDAATMRYAVDFVSLLALAALLVWLRIEGRPKRLPVRCAVAVVATAAVVASVLFGLAFSMTGYYDGLRVAHPRTYERIQAAFGFIPTLASKLQGKPAVLETRPQPGTPTAESVVQLAAPGAGSAVIRATPVAATLPPGSLVPADVREPDGPVTRIRMTIGTPTQMIVRFGGAGLADIRIGWGVARIAGTAALTDSAPAGVGLADIRVVEWSPR